MTLAAALVLASAAASAAPAWSDEAAFAAFRGGCGGLTSPEASAAAAQSAGWLPAQTDDEPRIKELAELLAAFTTVEGEQEPLPAVAYVRHYDGRDNWLLVTGVKFVGGPTMMSCQSFDFSAKAATDLATLTRLAGRPPERNLSEGQVTQYRWMPGLHEGYGFFEAVFQAEGPDAIGPAVGMTLSTQGGLIE